MQPPIDQVIGVKAFLEILKETLSFAFPMVTVEGEVSELKHWKQFVYFSLKEEETVLECFMIAAHLKTPLEDGMKIRAAGFPTFTKKGRFSFTVRNVSLAGEGELKRAFEILKERLGKEGLFAQERKRVLPKYPQTIGLITSATSAAYADFIKIINQRWGGVDIKLADVQVQGEAAPDQVVSAIQYFNQLASPVDVLVIIRGGGSLEDLQAFNAEAVARAVAGSRTPTIVGVGHEIDTSLADFAADKRAATPTDAARLVVPDRHQVAQHISHLQTGLEVRLQRATAEQFHQLQRLVNGLERFIRVPQQRVLQFESQLLSSQRNMLRNYDQKLQALARLVGSFDPTATLKRGYAIARVNGTVITSATSAKAGDALMVQLAKGEIASKIEGIKE